MAGTPYHVFHDTLMVLYFLCVGMLFVYGTNCYVLLVRFKRYRGKSLRECRSVYREFRGSDWFKTPPRVTVQLPIYNERYVVERLLRAVAALDYPRDRFEVQVLDDSTDDTAEILSRLVEQYRSQGVEIVHIRRATRRGFKAGALKVGMERARGEFLAIFDADFLPPPDFLRKTIPFFLNPRTGMVQMRWGHTNADDSMLTRAQSIGIDGHFAIEQGARAWSGLFLNFNGTAGIWRRQAIIDSGGWQADTLTEDLDLSYRAQLAGWKFRYLFRPCCPGEVPRSARAFKSQQFRWAKGSIQTARKMIPLILKSNHSWFVKYQAVLHLTHYLVHPLIVGMIALSFPFLRSDRHADYPWLLAAAFLLISVSTLGPSILYLNAQRAIYRRGGGRALWIPLLTVVGTGVALNNSRAVMEGLLSWGGDFIRTPKFGKSVVRDRTQAYAQRLGWLPFLELALGIYCLILFGHSLQPTAKGAWIAPFLLVYACGFVYMAIKSIGERHSSFFGGSQQHLAAPALHAGDSDGR